MSSGVGPSEMLEALLKNSSAPGDAADEGLSEEEILRGLEALANASSQPAPAHLKAKLLAGQSGQVFSSGFHRRLQQMFDLSSEDFGEILAKLPKGSEWQDFGPGVELFHLQGGPRSADADNGFVRFAPGTAFPAHIHQGEEWMFVVKGELTTDDGLVHREGSLIVSEPGTQHSFVVSKQGECVAAVVVFEGLLWADGTPMDIHAEETDEASPSE